ncbi:MAG TPA: hypothetical protein VGC01_04375 [Mucilaginibacter sp.]
MSSKIYYLYFFIVAGLLVLLAGYNYLGGHKEGYTSIIFDLVIALILFYRGYRVYKAKKDQELM